jgi:hypothetical protein
MSDARPLDHAFLPKLLPGAASAEIVALQLLYAGIAPKQAAFKPEARAVQGRSHQTYCMIG